MSAIHRLGVARLLEAFRGGRVSVVAATAHYLDRIARFNPALNAFVAVDSARARVDAVASASRWEAGSARALEGVPVAVKANIDVEGLATTAGVGARRHAFAVADAAVVARLRAAGAVILGHTNTHEAALGATTDNAFFGATHNPHRMGCTPGGSSGGSGAAVAAGLCAAALGTDTLGSVRIPAAYNGIYGLKPTPGLVPDAGLMFLVRRWDCIGPMARSVEDLSAMLAVMADRAPVRRDLLRIALLDETSSAAKHPSVAAAYRLAAQLLRGLGCSIEEHRSGIDLSRMRLAGFVEAAREADQRFAHDLARDPQGFSDQFKSYLAFARRFDARAVENGHTALEGAANALHGVLQAADCILLPTAPQPAFAHGGEPPSDQADFTALANIAGLPAVALPAGWSSDGLPVGVQLVGRPGDDVALLALAERLDRALNAYRPPQDFA